MTSNETWSTLEVEQALRLTDQALLDKFNKNLKRGFGIEEDERTIKSFVYKNIISIRDSICGKLATPEAKKDFDRRVEYTKDIATLLTAAFPPAIALYAAVAVLRIGVDNVCPRDSG